MALALFDLDNTLIAGDSDHAWGEFLVEIGQVDAASYREANDRFYQDYVSGQLDILEYLEFALQVLVGKELSVLQNWHRQFMRQKIEPLKLPAAESLLQQHRSQGDELVIITATNDFITAPIAQSLQVGTLLATSLEKTSDGFTGRVVGTPCFQEGKVTRLEGWLQKHPFDLTEAWFYSDSHNDIPLLERVGHPVAVDPDAELQAHAKQMGWPIMSLRKGDKPFLVLPGRKTYPAPGELC